MGKKKSNSKASSSSGGSSLLPIVGAAAGVVVVLVGVFLAMSGSPSVAPSAKSASNVIFNVDGDEYPNVTGKVGVCGFFSYFSFFFFPLLQPLAICLVSCLGLMQ